MEPREKGSSSSQTGGVGTKRRTGPKSRRQARALMPFQAGTKTRRKRWPVPVPRLHQGRMMKSAPAPSRLSAAAVKNQSAIDLTIQVRDTAVAIREIEERPEPSQGPNIERQHREGRGFLKAEIAAQKIAPSFWIV